MEAQTITCPNCGASTTNHQNCEYCGSFLVSIANGDFDFERFKMAMSTQNTDGITKVVKQWYDMAVSYNTINKNTDGTDYRLALYNKNDYDLDEAPLFQLYCSPEEDNSICIQLEDWNMDENLYIQKAFEGGESGVWYVYFGNDVKGAATFILECFKEIYGYTQKSILFAIFTPHQTITYDSEGNQLETHNNESHENYSDNNQNGGCALSLGIILSPIIGGIGYLLHSILS